MSLQSEESQPLPAREVISSLNVQKTCGRVLGLNPSRQGRSFQGKGRGALEDTQSQPLPAREVISRKSLPGHNSERSLNPSRQGRSFQVDETEDE